MTFFLSFSFCVRAVPGAALLAGAALAHAAHPHVTDDSGVQGTG